MLSPRSRRLLTTLVAPLLVVALAAGSSGASTRQSRERAAKVPTSIPAGTTLKIGDQLNYLATVLALSGEDKSFPYTVEYSAFVGGPPMLQAFQAGAIDSGFVGSTPLIFAQAAGQDIAAIAGWAQNGGTYSLVTAPGAGDIKGWKDLKGKRVVYQQGTAGEAALLQALESVGLELADITPVNLPVTQTAAALQGGSADAGLLVEPLTSVYLGANPTAKSVVKADEITDRSQFLIASQDTLNDKGKAAALGDYIARLVRAFAYTKANPEKVAEAVYVKQYGLPTARALEIIEENGGSSFVTLPGDVLKAQQHLADLFFAAGEIPAKVKAKQQFDTRYNDVVAAAQSGTTTDKATTTTTATAK